MKSRWFWIIFVIVGILVGGYVRSRQASKGPFYETVRVTRGDLVQTVEVTGEITPEARIDLAFRTNGTIAAIPAKVGRAVKKGDVLAQLSDRDAAFTADRAAATLAIAQANLSARLAGETTQAIDIARATVQQADAGLEKAQVDLELTKQSVEDEYRVAQIAMETARANLTNTGSTNLTSVANAVDTLRTALATSLGSIQSSLTDGDTIIGNDNTAANDNYESLLGLYERSMFEAAKNQYPAAKAAKLTAETALRSLAASSTASEASAVSSQMKDALQKTQLYLDYVQRTLAGTITSINLSATELASKKSTIDTDRASVSAQLSAVLAAEQALTTAEQGRTTNAVQLENALRTAEANLTIADHNRTAKVKTAETNVTIQEAALASARATLDLRQAGPRAVDVAALRAQVQEAQTAYAQAASKLADIQILAPADGIVTDILPSVGEEMAPNVIAIKMIATEGYTIEALVPEADIAKVEPDQSVAITLDAYGDDVTFDGKVLAENPDQTKVQDAIYYKAIVTIDPAGKDVKPGMTANLTVKTGTRTGALVVPTRSVRQKNGDRYVRTLTSGKAEEVKVELGLRGDEGRAEVVSGLTEGQIVIVSEVSADAYAKLEADRKAGQ